MKKIILISLMALSSMSSFASNPVVTCEMNFLDSRGNASKLLSFHDVGSYSVNDCIREAIKRKKVSSINVPFIFSHYSRTTMQSSGSVDVQVDSEGWSLSGEVNESGSAPEALKFSEFINP